MNSVGRLSSLLIFAEVATRKSFTQAAKKLEMSKSAVSQHIKRLEADTEQKLLSRNTRGVSLTAEGQSLLARCELLREQVDLAYDELNQFKKAPSGTFSLTIPHSVEQSIVVPALKQLCLEFPLLTINLNVTDQALDLIEHDLDVAIYAGELKDSNYRALPIGTANDVFCAHPAYIQKRGLITELKQLQHHNFIVMPWQKSVLNVVKNDQWQTIEVNCFAKTNTLPSALELIVNGMGVGLLPEFVVKPLLTTGELSMVMPSYKGKLWPFYMVHRFDREKPIHITRFYQLIQHFFLRVST